MQHGEQMPESLVDEIEPTPVENLYSVIIALPLPEAGNSYLTRYADESTGLDVVYLSTPITTGPRYLAWMRTHRLETPARRASAERELKADIMAENLKAVEPLRANIRRNWPKAYLIDPTEIEEKSWGQRDYHRFWLEVIGRFPKKVAFADGWEFSTGCCLEYMCAVFNGLEIVDATLHPIDPTQASVLLANSAGQLDLARLDSRAAKAALDIAKSTADAARTSKGASRAPLKDDRLAELAERVNVAIFASFAPGTAEPRHFFARTKGGSPSSLQGAVEQLLTESREAQLNVRSFRAGESKSSPFLYGLKTAEDVVAKVLELASEGYYTIVNETLDVHDGGVSGVQLGNVVEFSPDITPRGVERGGSCQMPLPMAERVLSDVYGFPVRFNGADHERVEFSVHPQRVGSRAGHMIDWEIENVGIQKLTPVVLWPNNFSQMIGDKTFGLLVAHALGFDVPYTVAVPRRVAPFSFGRRTGTGEWWTRTAPSVAEPGLFTTCAGWIDPYQLMQKEDGPSKRIASVLSQEYVAGTHSGAATYRGDEEWLIEGIAGDGDSFMLGLSAPEVLSDVILDSVKDILLRFAELIGFVDIEWVFDGEVVWIVQLHISSNRDQGFLNFGEASEWRSYRPSDGLDSLRSLIAQIEGTSIGIEILEPIGITSHVGDLLRRSRIPARFAQVAES